MGFVKRIFTPPGTGGAEAAAQQMQTDMSQMKTQQAQAAATPPAAPTMPTAPAPPQVMMPSGTPGAKKAGGAAKSPTSFLGAPIEGGNQARKSLLGQ